MGTSGTFRTVTSEPDVTDQKCEKPAWNGHCDGVTVQKRGEGHFARSCEHCGLTERPDDPVMECFVDGEQHQLHRGCQKAWLAADPDGWSFNTEGLK